MTLKGKKIKFNIIDFLILLIAVFIIASVLLRYNLADIVNSMAKQDKIEMEFIVENIQEASQNYLTAGESFHITAASVKLGEIKEILDIRPAVTFVQNIEGDILKSEAPTRIDVIGVLSCYGRKVESGYMINGNVYSTTGKEFLVHTGKLEVSITILNVRLVDEVK